MKKFISFLKYNKGMTKFYLFISTSLIVLTVIGLLCSLPVFWQKYAAYKDSILSDVSNYAMIPFFSLLMLGIFFAGMILWYYSKRMEVAKDNDGRRIMKGMAIFMGIFPGCFLVSKIMYPILQITYFGPWNALVGLAIGFIYIRIGSWLIKKPMDYIIAI